MNINSSRQHWALVVGAGFSGAVLAREIAENTGLQVLVIDQREHIAGNCHTSRDEATNVMVHRYGPHIFHTNRADIWDYVNRFGRFNPFINRVKAVNCRGVFSLPINLHTINQFFNKRFTPKEARAFLKEQSDTSIVEPKNFEEMALHFVGKDLYYGFFYGYTKKQWGCEPSEISASVLKRLPIRFNYDDNYYNSTFQGIPVDGYTEVVRGILDHPNIEVKLGVSFDQAQTAEFRHSFYTGPIDGFFGYRLGRLGYRTVTFERIEDEGDFQGNAVLNYNEADVPYTRIHEHKHFTPWESHERTVAFREYSKATAPEDTPYYPIRTARDKEILAGYIQEANGLRGVSFLGRLGTYRYLDMDKVIGEALDFGRLAVMSIQQGSEMPVFLPGIEG